MFTGTQIGMTDFQKNQVIEFLKNWEYNEFIHGNCIGADADFHELVRKYIKNSNIITLSVYKGKCANCKSDFNLIRNDYLARNREMVKSADYIIGCPKTNYPTKRGGTFYTLRYAQKENLNGLIFWATEKEQSILVKTNLKDYKNE